MHILGNKSTISNGTFSDSKLVVERLYGDQDGELHFLSRIMQLRRQVKSTKVSYMFNTVILSSFWVLGVAPAHKDMYVWCACMLAKSLCYSCSFNEYIPTLVAI